jgi:hypothetical protein
LKSKIGLEEDEKMARKVSASASPTTRVVGTVVMGDLSLVKRNTWNPNKLTPFMMESLKSGLLNDGWLSSQALLIWGSDEKGKKQNIIIDGEHRWTVGQELGFKEGPMVFLEKLSEAKAKALTIKMNQKRGEFDERELGALLREIQTDFTADNLSLEFGIDNESLVKLLNEPVILLPDDPLVSNGSEGGVGNEVLSSMASHVRQVPLFFDKAQYADFAALVKSLSKKYKTQDLSLTVLEAMRASSTT